jgi:hypothetical protein
MSFLVLHSVDGDQLVLPRSFVPDYTADHDELKLAYRATLIRPLVAHLIERSKVLGQGGGAEEVTELDRNWFRELKPSQYVAMVGLANELQLTWASGLIVSHVAEHLRQPGLDWSSLDQLLKALG